MDPFRIISTNYGKIRGKLEIGLFSEKEFYSFRGIPYARPPLQTLRFKAPCPIEPWNDVKDAFEYGNISVQYNRLEDKVEGEEDCLYLNVFAPVGPSSENALPVMVYIHGGGYNMGSSNLYGPDFLVSHHIILVTVNYRQGPLGFGSFGLPEYSGNNGLKDQFAALQWVHQNISHFGGDCLNVTVFGQSAGSASVQFHLLSAESRKLFKRVILQSGSILNPWAFYPESSHIELLKKFAAKHNFNSNIPEELLKFLQTVDAKDLTRSTHYRFFVPGESEKVVGSIWAPVLEASNAFNPILTEHPEKILSGSEIDVDILMGFTTAETYDLTYKEIMDMDHNLLESFYKDFKVQLPWESRKYNFNSDEYPSIAQEIRNFYFPNNIPINGDSVLQYNDLLSDMWMVYGIDRTVKLLQKGNKGNTFYYKFDLENRLNLPKELSGANEANLPGSSHCDDLYYLFRMSDYKYENLSKESDEVKSIKLMTKIWTNFAKNGDPNLKTDGNYFKPIQSEKIYCTNINNRGVILEENPLKERMEFWTNLQRKYSKN